MKIAIATDHGGYEAAEKIKKYLTEQQHEVVDFGSNSLESVDYPDFGFPAAQAVADKKCDRGILVCTTGVGMSIVGNKVKGVRAALCFNEEMGMLCREHNFANVLVIPSKYLDQDTINSIVDKFLTTEGGAERHARRVSKINDFDDRKCADNNDCGCCQ